MGIFGGGPTEWFLYNLDTDDKVQGQFPAENVVENLGSVWNERHALNSQHGIMQWIHGKTRTISFKARLFMTSEFLGKQNDPTKKLNMLKSWTVRANETGRAPIFAFWIGDTHLRMDQCVLLDIANITYKKPTFSGALRDVSFNITLKEWHEYSLEVSGGTGETRYHHAIQDDYYEMLTHREYGDAAMGDIIRKRHSTHPNIQVGDIIKLPSATALVKERVAQTSIALQTAYGKLPTAQKVLREDAFDRRNESKLSTVILEY